MASSSIGASSAPTGTIKGVIIPYRALSDRSGSACAGEWCMLPMISKVDADVATVIALERRLLQPSVRGSVTALDALLDPESQEIGAPGGCESAMTWSRR